MKLAMNLRRDAPALEAILVNRRCGDVGSDGLDRQINFGEDEARASRVDASKGDTVDRGLQHVSADGS